MPSTPPLRRCAARPRLAVEVRESRGTPLADPRRGHGDRLGRGRIDRVRGAGGSSRWHTDIAILKQPANTAGPRDRTDPGRRMDIPREPVRQLRGADNADNTAKLEVTVGTGQSNNPAQELEGNIRRSCRTTATPTSNLATPDPEPVNSRFFQQSVTRGFTADDSTPPAAEHKGMFTELVNTTTGMAAFAAFQASTNNYDLSLRKTTPPT